MPFQFYKRRDFPTCVRCGGGEFYEDGTCSGCLFDEDGAVERAEARAYSRHRRQLEGTGSNSDSESQETAV